MIGSWSRRAWLRSLVVAAGGMSVRATGWAQDLERPPPEGKHINLAGNENPFGPSPDVVRRILRAAPESCRYPFREEYVLKELIARREQVPIDHILLGNGADEVLALAAAAFLTPGGEVVATTPTYFQLTDYAAKRGAIMRWVPHRRETMQHDLPALERAVGSKTQLVYVCNPDNPTGTAVNSAELEAFCRAVCPRAPVVVDEVYLELQDSFPADTQVRLIQEGLPLIVVRSFSKMHGLAGHRIGYAVAPPRLLETLQRWQMSSLNYLGVIAARESLFDQSFHAWTLGKIRAGRARFCALLDELGLRYTPSHGNFVFHEVRRPVTDYQARMEVRGFLVNWPHAPVEPYLDWCRTSIGTDDEMRRHEQAMREVFAAA